MRKTEGITKYEVQWQLVRSRVKGSKTELEHKLSQTATYFNETLTYDRWERVYNWLEGLHRGYKAAGNLDAMNRIKDEMAFYELEKFTCFYCVELDPLQQAETLSKASREDIKSLWQDLFRTNEKWLKKGYFHGECNAFMDWLFVKGDFEIKDRYSINHLKELRGLCVETTNTHNFFF